MQQGAESSNTEIDNSGTGLLIQSSGLNLKKRIFCKMGIY